MKILLLLIPFASFAQTGKIKGNGTVTVSFETIAGVTAISIQNNSSIESEIEYKYNGLFHSVTLPWAKSVKFQTMDSVFFISARNITDLSGGSEWLEVDSRIRATEITATKSIQLTRKIQCGEIYTTRRDSIILH